MIACVYGFVCLCLFESESAWAKTKPIKKVETKHQESNAISPKQVMANHTDDLRALMLQLYEAHPQELAKSTKVGAREMAEWVFDGKANWKFDAIRHLQAKQAIALLFDEQYQGDHVLPLIVGLETLLFNAYGAPNEYNIPNEVDSTQVTQARCDVKALQGQLASILKVKSNQMVMLENANSFDAINQTLSKLMQAMMLIKNVDEKCD